jgi:hypothetical protein
MDLARMQARRGAIFAAAAARAACASPTRVATTSHPRAERK